MPHITDRLDQFFFSVLNPHQEYQKVRMPRGGHSWHVHSPPGRSKSLIWCHAPADTPVEFFEVRLVRADSVGVQWENKDWRPMGVVDTPAYVAVLLRPRDQAAAARREEAREAAEIAAANSKKAAIEHAVLNDLQAAMLGTGAPTFTTRDGTVYEMNDDKSGYKKKRDIKEDE